MINFRTHEERVKYLYIEGTQLDGSSVLIGQASCVYSESQQVNINFNIFDESIYNKYKDCIEENLTDFRLKCEVEIRNTENCLFGSVNVENLIEVFDSEGNKLGLMNMYKNDSTTTLPIE